MIHPDGFQVLIVLDQLANIFIGGMADETLSSRAHRRKLRGKSFIAKVINFIFFWQNDHCKEAYESELKRKHLPNLFNK